MTRHEYTRSLPERLPHHHFGQQLPTFRLAVDIHTPTLANLQGLYLSMHADPKAASDNRALTHSTTAITVDVAPKVDLTLRLAVYHLAPMAYLRVPLALTLRMTNDIDSLVHNR